MSALVQIVDRTFPFSVTMTRLGGMMSGLPAKTWCTNKLGADADEGGFIFRAGGKWTWYIDGTDHIFFLQRV